MNASAKTEFRHQRVRELAGLKGRAALRGALHLSSLQRIADVLALGPDRDAIFRALTDKAFTALDATTLLDAIEAHWNEHAKNAKHARGWTLWGAQTVHRLHANGEIPQPKSADTSVQSEISFVAGGASRSQKVHRAGSLGRGRVSWT